MVCAGALVAVGRTGIGTLLLTLPLAAEITPAHTSPEAPTALG